MQLKRWYLYSPIPYLAINIDFSKDEGFQIGRNGSMINELAGKVMAMLWQKSAANLSV